MKEYSVLRFLSVLKLKLIMIISQSVELFNENPPERQTWISNQNKT
jgi:hypothetical protein